VHRPRTRSREIRPVAFSPLFPRQRTLLIGDDIRCVSTIVHYMGANIEYGVVWCWRSRRRRRMPLEHSVAYIEQRAQGLRGVPSVQQPQQNVKAFSFLPSPDTKLSIVGSRGQSSGRRLRCAGRLISLYIYHRRRQSGFVLGWWKVAYR
jgi:hypothetical protein